MASIQYALFAFGLVLMMIVQGGESIRCFECNSHKDPRCADKEPPAELSTECTEKKKGANTSFCRKTIQIIEFSVNNLPPDTRTIRTCGSEAGKYKDSCYQRSGFGGRQEVCACSDKDNCNGAATIKATFGVLLAAIVVFVARA